MDLFDLALYRALNKGGGGGDITVEPLTVTENGQYAAPSGKAYSPVNVAVSGGGGGGASAGAVNFRDYDGTIVQSYSAADFAALTAMPENPSHDGLTAQGWNWTLAKAQAYVAKYGKLEIGQMYITDDGKTRVYIHLEQGRTSPMLGCCPNGTVDVDWGDGTEHDTLTGTSVSEAAWTPTHNYAAPGDYVIQLTVTGSMGFYGSLSSNQYSGLLRYESGTDNRNRVYQNAIQRIEIGRGVTSIGSSAFNNCYSLSSISVPDGVTSIGNYAFNNCYSLSSISIPDGVTSIGNYAFNNCYSLSSISIPDSVTSIGSYAFYYCSSLASISVPDGVTSIGDYAFNNCYSLSSISISDSVTSIGSSAFNNCSSLASISVPDGVTSIGSSAFNNCSSLASISIPDSVTSIGSYAFNNCYSLSSISVPDGVTSIGNYAFNNCYSLSSISISDSVTSIGSSAFNNCYSLSSISVPDGVTSIRSNAFSGCYGISEYHFTRTTPPTLSNTNAFNGIAADCIIYVPYSDDHSILNAYKTASNWSNYESNMQEEPA